MGHSAARARRPFGEAGRPSPQEQPRAGSPQGPQALLAGSRGEVARGVAYPGDPSRSGRSAPCARPLPEEPKSRHARGRCPHDGQGGWTPGLFGAGCCSGLPALRSPADGDLRVQKQPNSPLYTPRSDHADPSQQPANAPASSLARRTRENAPTPARIPSLELPGPAFPLQPTQPPNYLKPPALGQSTLHTPSQTVRGRDHSSAAILIPRRVKQQSAAGRRRR